MSCHDDAVEVGSHYTNWADHMTEAYYPVTVAYWQARLCSLNYYSGPIDGFFGPNSRAGVQQDMADHYGYVGPVDGVWGPNTWTAIQKFAHDQGSYQGPIDGVPGPNTWAGIYFAVVPML